MWDFLSYRTERVLGICLDLVLKYVCCVLCVCCFVFLCLSFVCFSFLHFNKIGARLQICFCYSNISGKKRVQNYVRGICH